MSVTQRRGAIRPIEPHAPASSVAPWLLAVGKGIGLLAAALAVLGTIDGIVRSSPIVILVSWSLLSLAATALFALSRAVRR